MGFHKNITGIALSKQTITSSFLRKLEKGFQLIYELSHQDAKIFRFFLVNSSFLSTMKDIALI